MASQKTLELRKIKPNNYLLGDYEFIGGRYFRAFTSGSIITSKDGKTQYLVGKDGSFKKIKKT